MPTTKQQYINELNAIAGRYGSLEDTTIKRMLSMVKDLRTRIAAEIVNVEGWEDFRRRELERNLGRLINEFQQRLGPELGQAVQDTVEFGGQSVVQPMVAAGIETAFFQPDTALLNTLLDFSAKLVQDIGDSTRAAIDQQVRLAALGQKTPTQAMQGITKELIGAGKARVKIWKKRHDPVKGIAARAETILRTELQRAFNLSTFSQQQASAERIPGLTKSWVATGDVRTRISHLRAHMKYKAKPISINAFFEVGGAKLLYPGDPNGPPGETINCVLPDNTIQAPDMQAMSRARYDGSALEIILASGDRLTVTPNHPVLTIGGFVPAHLLNEGEYVVSRTVIDREMYAVDKHYDYMPSLLEEIWGALGISRTAHCMRRSVVPQDLHGDAGFTQGYVDVVGADGFLMHDLPASCVSQVSNENHLGRRGFGETLLAGQGPSVQFVGRHDASPDSLMGRRREFRALFLGHPLHSQAIGLADAPALYTGSDKTAFKAIPRYAGLACQALLSLTGFVTPNEIVKIQDFEFRGHVYDLQCFTQLYTSSSVLVKNCRCRSVTHHPAIGRVGSNLDGRISQQLKARAA